MSLVQVGVGLQGGVEALTAEMQAIERAHQQHAIDTLGIRNALGRTLVECLLHLQKTVEVIAHPCPEPRRHDLAQLAREDFKFEHLGYVGTISSHTQSQIWITAKTARPRTPRCFVQGVLVAPHNVGRAARMSMWCGHMVAINTPCPTVATHTSKLAMAV